MADLSRSTDGPSPDSRKGFDESLLPDFHREFISEADLQVFANALSAPEPSPSTDDLSASHNGLTSPSRASIDSGVQKLGGGPSQSSLFITAQNDWAPVHPSSKIGSKGKRKGDKKSGRRSRRSSDETREGYLYTLLKWPMLAIVGAWVVGLGAGYLLTRLYISLYGVFHFGSDSGYQVREEEGLTSCRTFHCVARQEGGVKEEAASHDELYRLGEGGEGIGYIFGK
jgi:hypothetical protein